MLLAELNSTISKHKAWPGRNVAKEVRIPMSQLWVRIACAQGVDMHDATEEGPGQGKVCDNEGG
jgi:hypothetical protein